MKNHHPISTTMSQATKVQLWHQRDLSVPDGYPVPSFPRVVPTCWNQGKIRHKEERNRQAAWAQSYNRSQPQHQVRPPSQVTRAIVACTTYGSCYRVSSLSFPSPLLSLARLFEFPSDKAPNPSQVGYFGLPTASSGPPDLDEPPNLVLCLYDSKPSLREVLSIYRCSSVIFAGEPLF
jgi:hypothetical protein